MVLSEKGEDEGGGPCGQVVYRAECERAKHSCDNRREKESGWEDAEEEGLRKC